VTDRGEDGPGGGPLAGIRVLEFGSLLAGPLCARLLGDFGADVIKIEAPGAPDPLRHWGQEPFHGRDLLWTIYARNKRCVTLDLRQEEGRALARALASRSDLVVENFRPGTLERWGLGPADLKPLNPGLIFVRVSGYGQSGPYSQRAGFGSVAEAMGGIRHLTGYPDRPSTRVGVSLGDSLAALFGVVGALLALHARGRGGAGQVVDVAIYEAVYALMESLIPEYVLQGRVRERSGATIPHVAPSNVYPCADGVAVLIAANADNVFLRLCQAIGQPALAADPRFATHQARGEHMAAIDDIVAAWTSRHPSDEVVRLMEAAGVPAGLVYTAREIAADPHFRARGMIVPTPLEDGVEFPMPGIVPALAETPGAIRWPGPTTAGSHNREVYGDLLGLSDEELADLARRGVI
jgi:succinyl-CoA---D-citramalate CoA-transferase